MTEQKDQRGFFGRRLGRPLNDSRRKALDEIYPLLKFPEDTITENRDLDPLPLFSSPPCLPNEIWMEIGFGDGKHLLELIRRHPDKGYIGCEPFINGMSGFLKDIAQLKGHDLTQPRVRLFMDDAMMLCRSLRSHSLDGLYILNPDPWHKKRHYKRRIISKENLNEFARILKPGGSLIISSDVADLNDWMITHTYTHPDFEWLANGPEDWQSPPNDWITTTYEIKGAKGASKMCYFFFKRR